MLYQVIYIDRYTLLYPCTDYNYHFLFLYLYLDANTSQKKILIEYGAIKVLTGMLNPNNIIPENHLIVILEGLKGFHGEQDSYNLFFEQFEELGGCQCLEHRQRDQNLSENTFNAIINFMKMYRKKSDTFEENDCDDCLLKD